jgi:cysteine synthase A
VSVGLIRSHRYGSCEFGARKVDGVGAGFVVPLWHDGVADRIERVSTEEAVAMAVRLAREEGLFAGTSTGGNVTAALRLAERPGSDATIVTVMCDTGMNCLSNAAYLAHATGEDSTRSS